MGSTLSTAHRFEIRRALYLTPSNKKLGESDKGQSTATNELPHQWAVRELSL